MSYQIIKTIAMKYLLEEKSSLGYKLMLHIGMFGATMEETKNCLKMMRDEGLIQAHKNDDPMKIEFSLILDDTLQ